MATTKTTILDLPDEILLEVGKCLRSTSQLYANQELVNFAAAHPRFKGAAQEIILVNPTVNLYRVGELLRTYARYPNLAMRVKTLEISTFGLPDSLDMVDIWFDYLNGPEYGQPWVWDKAPQGIFNRRFERQCAHLIEWCPYTNGFNKSVWLFDLKDNQPRAYLGVLLMILVNLKSLLLGPNPLQFFPMLESVGPTDSERRALSNAWNRAYLSHIFATILPRLQTLEMPAGWDINPINIEDADNGTGATSVVPYLHTPVPRLWELTSLRRLVFPCGMLPPVLSSGPEAICRMFPRSLEVLVFHEAMVNWRSTWMNFMMENKETHFPALCRIEIYSFIFGTQDRLDADALTKNIGEQTGTEVLIWRAKVPNVHDCIVWWYDAKMVQCQPWRYSPQELSDNEVMVKERWVDIGGWDLFGR